MRLDLEGAVRRLEVMPSMRALMTAGPALARDNVCAYNCSYLPVSSPRAFDECLYILMVRTFPNLCLETPGSMERSRIKQKFKPYRPERVGY